MFLKRELPLLRAVPRHFQQPQALPQFRTPCRILPLQATTLFPQRIFTAAHTIFLKTRSPSRASAQHLLTRPTPKTLKKPFNRTQSFFTRRRSATPTRTLLTLKRYPLSHTSTVFRSSWTTPLQRPIFSAPLSTAQTSSFIRQLSLSAVTEP